MVDIEQDPEAAHLVEQVNNGNQTVPTLVFSDGTAQTNPSLIAGQGEARRPRLLTEGVAGGSLTRCRAAPRRTSARPATG